MRLSIRLAPLLFALGCGDDIPETATPETGTSGAAGTDTGSGMPSTSTPGTAADSTDDTGPQADTPFPPMGPLVGDAGLGTFRFGAASAATQIEDSNETVDWWLWSTPMPDGLGHGEFLGDASRGYSLALEDLDLIADLGLDTYRFSIEWARVEPERDVIDEEALAHYDAFIDGLVERGIRPMITVHHFSNPVWIDDPRDVGCMAGPGDANLCGWDHVDGGPLVVEEFAEHAALLAERYGDRVDEWGTLNEPVNYMLAAYGLQVFPPGKNGILFGFEDVLLAAIRNFISGHAAAYDAIKATDTIDADGDGVVAAVGLTKGAVEWVAARDNAVSDHPDDIAARDRIDYVMNFMFVDAIVQGAFDPQLDGELDEMHPEWEGKLDWLGVQYYFRGGVTAEPGLIPIVEVTPCFGSFDLGACVPPIDPTYHVPLMEYEHWPQGLYARLHAVAERFPGLPLLVSESGIATRTGARRAENIVRALESIERARDEGIDVRGYYHWSLYDNYEWAEGYAPRFGLYQVDYDTYARTPTLGADVLTEIVAARDVSADLHATYGGEGPMTPER